MQHPGDSTQQGVAGGMAVLIVDGLEAIQIDETEHQPAAAAAALGEGGAHAVGEQLPVGQAGQRVVAGAVVFLLAGLLHLGDEAVALDGMAQQAQQIVAVELAFHHIVLRAMPQCEQGGLLVVVAGEHDQGHLGAAFADAIHARDALAVWQAKVQQYAVVMPARQCRLSSSQGGDVVDQRRLHALDIGQGLAQRAGVAQGVFHQQQLEHGVHGGTALGGRRLSPSQ